MDMTQLNGHEASVLAFIARSPRSQEAARLAKTLTGHASQIADTLINGATATTDVSTGAAAEAMRKWALAGS